MAFYKIGAGEQCLSLVSVNNVVDVVATCINNPSFYNETFIVKDAEDYSINEIIRHFKAIYTQENKPVIKIPLFLPSSIFKIFKLIMPRKGEFYQHNLKKIAQDSIYSVEKLLSTGISLKWNLKNTLRKHEKVI